MNNNVHNKNEAGNYIWNAIGGMLNAGQSVLVLIIVTRVCGLEAAGLYSIAFATGNLFMYLGNYGVRNYQVSDVDEKFPFRSYILHRLLTVALMLLAAAVYCAYSLLRGAYSPAKTMTVAAMCLLKAIDCLEEVLEGRLHQRGRLDLAGKMMTVRLLVSIGGMLAVLVATGNLLTATNAAIILAAAAVILMAAACRRTLLPLQPAPELVADVGNAGAVPGAAAKNRGAATSPAAASAAVSAARRGALRDAAVLMRVCFPVCAANFLSFYLINAPKYAIDAAMNETAQAQYNFIAMPVFVIQLLGMFVYQPVLVRMTGFSANYGRPSDYRGAVSWRGVCSGNSGFVRTVRDGSFCLEAGASIDSYRRCFPCDERLLQRRADTDARAEQDSCHVSCGGGALPDSDAPLCGNQRYYGSGDFVCTDHGDRLRAAFGAICRGV